MTAQEIDTNELPEYGPAMLALPTEKQRKFVCALFDEDAPRKGEGLLLYAAKVAGYGTPTSSSKSLTVIASRVAHDARVQKGIEEHSHRVMRAIPPEAILALKDLIRDPKHRDHARAIAMVLDRTDPLQTLHTVKVEDNRAPSIEATQAVLDRIEKLMKRVGLAPPPKVIDGDFQVIEKGTPA